MARFVNQLTMTAIVATEVELRQTRSGKTVGSFTVSIPIEQEGSETMWESFSTEVWEATAKLCAERLTKGSKVLIIGSLKQDRWESEQGTESKVYIRAAYVEFLRIKEVSIKEEAS